MVSWLSCSFASVLGFCSQIAARGGTKQAHTIIWGATDTSTNLTAEISPDPEKPLSDLGDQAQAFYL